MFTFLLLYFHRFSGGVVCVPFCQLGPLHYHVSNGQRPVHKQTSERTPAPRVRCCSCSSGVIPAVLRGFQVLLRGHIYIWFTTFATIMVPGFFLWGTLSGHGGPVWGARAGLGLGFDFTLLNGAYGASHTGRRTRSVAYGVWHTECGTRSAAHGASYSKTRGLDCGAGRDGVMFSVLLRGGSHRLATSRVFRGLEGDKRDINGAAVCHRLRGLYTSNRMQGFANNSNSDTYCRCTNGGTRYHRRCRLGYARYNGLVRTRYGFLDRLSTRVCGRRNFGISNSHAILCKIYNSYLGGRE